MRGGLKLRTSTFDIWLDIKRAYFKEASIWALMKLLFRERKLESCLTFSIDIIAIILFIYITFKADSKHISFIFIFYMITALLLYTSFVCLNNLLESIYKQKFNIDLSLYEREDRVIERYILFREALLKRNINRFKISRVSEILEHELKFYKERSFFEILRNNPFMSLIFALIVAVAGGAASIEEAWTSMILPKIIFALIVIITLIHFFGYIFKPKSYKYEELKLFLTWFVNDEFPKK